MRRDARKEEILRHKDKVLSGKRAKLTRELERRKAAGEELAEEEWRQVDSMEFSVEEMTLLPLAEKSSIVQLHTGQYVYTPA